MYLLSGYCVYLLSGYCVYLLSGVYCVYIGGSVLRVYLLSGVYCVYIYCQGCIVCIFIVRGVVQDRQFESICGRIQHAKQHVVDCCNYTAHLKKDKPTAVSILTIQSQI